MFLKCRNNDYQNHINYDSKTLSYDNSFSTTSKCVGLIKAAQEISLYLH